MFSEFTYLWLFAAGGLAGFVDSIAGGGGLISLPALLATGMPPVEALATNKLQSSFGSFTAACNYVRRQGVKLQEMRRGIFFTFVGAATGTTLVQFIDTGFLRDVIPILLVVTAIFFLLQPRLMALGKRELMPAPYFQVIFGLSLGFYDGFFGPGTGSFWMLAFVALQAKDLVSATARTKVYNFTSNVTALVFFLVGGAPQWLAGFSMAAGQVLGARLGSSLALAWGPKLIRPLLILISLAITIRMMG